MIYLSVEPSIRNVLNNLSDEDLDDPARVWEVLRQKYDSASLKSGRIDIINRFHTSTMKSNVTVAEYISDLLAIRQELAGSDEAISDTTVVSHLLRTVPDSFAITVGILKHKSPEEQTLDSVSAALIEEETSLARRNTQVGSTLNTAGTLTSGNALAAGVQRRGGRGGRGGHRRWQPYANQRKAELNQKCHYCLREGHRERDCSLKQNAADYKKERLGEWSATAASAQFTVKHDDAHECGLNCTEFHGF